MISQYQPLFLKYRPQAISELVGQEHVAITLANAIKYKRISHAYLFTGPRGTGKTSAARIFAKSLNCELGPTAEPCQKCTSCIEIKQGISPSVFEIDAASNNSVDDARLLIERAPLSACGGRFKLYIIDECHMLTKEAFNALLKTIEEPPANVIFILATTEEHKVLPTIVSRCQKLIFRLINDEDMIKHLASVAIKENIIIEEEALKALGRRANGGLRDALSLLDQISLLAEEGQTISTQDVLLLSGALPEDVLYQICTHIFRKEGQKVLALLKELFISGREAHLIAAELAKYMLGLAKIAYSEEERDKEDQGLYDLAKLIDQSELIQMIEELDRLEVSCRRSSQPIMNLEIGLLSLCHRLDILQLRSIQSRLQKLEHTLKLTAESALIEEPEAIKEPKAILKTLEKKVVEKVEEISDLADDDTLPAAPTETQAITQPKNDGAKNNIDLVWQNILAELQRRHLPTFSLVSTHAFPLELSEDSLTIGVFVENFQKMIENKVDYIKNAAISCNLNKNLKITVKVGSNGEQIGSVSQKKNDFSELEKPLVNAAKINSGDEKQEQGAVKEAYRLFEGPGSRYIAPN